MKILVSCHPNNKVLSTGEDIELKGFSDLSTVRLLLEMCLVYSQSVYTVCPFSLLKIILKANVWSHTGVLKTLICTENISHVAINMLKGDVNKCALAVSI